MIMNANDVSIAVYRTQVDAVANAQTMRNNGFEVSPVLEVSNILSWNDFTVTPAKQEDASTPAWVVIGRR